MAGADRQKELVFETVVLVFETVVHEAGPVFETVVVEVDRVDSQKKTG